VKAAGACARQTDRALVLRPHPRTDASNVADLAIDLVG
jgi:hypothetical protein